jgi:hypothetical protein
MALLQPPRNLLRAARVPEGLSTHPVLELQPEEDPVDQAADKKKKVPPLLGAPPESLAILRGPEDLQRYNLDALKKIARMGAVTLPKVAPRALCVERLTEALFVGTVSVPDPEEDEDVHTVNLSGRL